MNTKGSTKHLNNCTISLQKLKVIMVDNIYTLYICKYEVDVGS